MPLHGLQEHAKQQEPAAPAASVKQQAAAATSAASDESTHSNGNAQADPYKPSNDALPEGMPYGEYVDPATTTFDFSTQQLREQIRQAQQQPEQKERESGSISAGVPYEEPKRLDYLKSLGIMDSPPQKQFDNITSLCCFIFKVRPGRARHELHASLIAMLAMPRRSWHHTL